VRDAAIASRAPSQVARESERDAILLRHAIIFMSLFCHYSLRRWPGRHYYAAADRPAYAATFDTAVYYCLLYHIVTHMPL